MAKVPVVNREDYIMYLEYHSGFLWLHSDVRKWTSKIKVKYLEDLHLLQHLVSVPLMALSHEDDKKLMKFGKTIGFEFKQPLLGQDNRMYHIYSRSL